MSAPASAADQLHSILFDMEDDVHALVHWGQAFRAMGAGDAMVSADAIAVMADAAATVATRVQSRWRDAIHLSRQEMSTVPEVSAFVGFQNSLAGGFCIAR